MKIALIALTVLTSIAAQAEKGDFVTKPLEKGKPNVLTCSDMSWGDDDDPSLMSLTVIMNDQGIPVSMRASRKAPSEDGKLPKFDLAIESSASSKFVRATIKNKISGVDEETNKPVYESNIENVDVLEGRTSDGKQIRVILNDHTYSGHPGSSFVVKAAGMTVESGGPCEGPGAAKLDLGDDL